MSNKELTTTKQNFMSWLSRFRNTGTLIALVGAIGLVLQQFGFKIDMEWLNNTIVAICSVLVILGFCNDPTTKGMDTPFKQK